MRRLRRFGFNRIKEGFDQLPTAICFFDSRGSIVLCNRQMYRLSHYLFESDMQYLGEVERALATPPEGILHITFKKIMTQTIHLPVAKNNTSSAVKKADRRRKLVKSFLDTI